MADAVALVTVYRSMDSDAREDCETIECILKEEGLHPLIFDDTAPGVPEGVYEVQVPADEAARAEEIIARNPLPDEVEEVDDAPDLDMETIYHSESGMGEFEALEIKNLLNANGIAAIVAGDSVLPNFPFAVRVAREQAEQAKALIAEAERTGPAAAEEAERAGEEEAAAALEHNQPPNQP